MWEFYILSANLPSNKRNVSRTVSYQNMSIKTSLIHSALQCWCKKRFAKSSFTSNCPHYYYTFCQLCVVNNLFFCRPILPQYLTLCLSKLHRKKRHAAFEMKNCCQPKKCGCHKNGLFERISTTPQNLYGLSPAKTFTGIRIIRARAPKAQGRRSNFFQPIR